MDKEEIKQKLNKAVESVTKNHDLESAKFLIQNTLLGDWFVANGGKVITLSLKLLLADNDNKDKVIEELKSTIKKRTKAFVKLHYKNHKYLKKIQNNSGLIEELKETVKQYEEEHDEVAKLFVEHDKEIEGYKNTLGAERLDNKIAKDTLLQTIKDLREDNNRKLEDTIQKDEVIELMANELIKGYLLGYTQNDIYGKASVQDIKQYFENQAKNS